LNERIPGVLEEAAREQARKVEAEITVLEEEAGRLQAEITELHGEMEGGI
jgi:hypothetical protein